VKGPKRNSLLATKSKPITVRRYLETVQMWQSETMEMWACEGINVLTKVSGALY